MSRHCTICDDPRRAEIDAALVSERGYRAVAKRFGLSESATYRHRAEHLPESLMMAREAGEIARADSLLGDLRSLHERTVRILCEAENAGDLRVALQAVREARGNMELMAKLVGHIGEGSRITVNVGQEWPSLRSKILDALVPYPEARTALAAALEGWG